MNWKKWISSKKARALFTGLAMLVARPLLSRVGVDLDEEQVQTGVALLGTYIVGQGIADAGKERAKIERGLGPANLPPPGVPQSVHSLR